FITFPRRATAFADLSSLLSAVVRWPARTVLIEFSTSALNARSNSLLISFTIFRTCAAELFTVHVCEADVAVLFLKIDFILYLNAFIHYLYINELSAVIS